MDGHDNKDVKPTGFTLAGMGMGSQPVQQRNPIFGKQKLTNQPVLVQSGHPGSNYFQTLVAANVAALLLTDEHWSQVEVVRYAIAMAVETCNQMAELVAAADREFANVTPKPPAQETN